ncbi:BTAD domain-containing putative transcriptional regulator [Jatrophihabitans sp. YIM 134969]
MTRYRLLGPVEVDLATGPAPLGGRKQRAVLAALALDAGRVVSSDRLAEVVWGERHPPSAAASLQAYVSNLRRVLRDDDRAASPILRKGDAYVLDVAPSDTDLGEFSLLAAEVEGASAGSRWAEVVDAADRTTALWRGPLLAEYRDEEWVRVAAGPLEERLLAVRQHRVTGLLGLDRVAEAVGHSRALAGDHPLDERACWLHAVTLYRAGRSGDALAVLREHTERLDLELGLDPGPALRDLQAAVLRQDAALATWPRTDDAVVTPGVVEPASVAPVRTPPHVGPPPALDPLIGRAHELGVLRALLGDAAAAGARWVALSGTAGIGKSRLAEEATRLWTTDGQVVRADCPDDTGTPAHWPLRHALTALGADADAVLTPPPGTDADAARFATYDAVRHALREATADRPLLLLVEDVHWADTPTLRLLTHLCSTDPTDLPGLAVVVTVREGEGGAEVGRLLLALARRSGARLLPVPPLPAADVALLVEQVSGRPCDDARARELADRTGGNAFFVSEYARLPERDQARGDVPAAVRSVLGRRLAAVDPDVVQVLRTAAVIGEHLDLDLLARVTRTDRADLADLLDDAADEHLIVPAPGTGDYTFAHALLREEALAGLSVVRRQRLHLRVAEALAHGGTGADNPARRATHLLAAGVLADPVEVLQACRDAAEEAERSWHPDVAAEWWGHAVAAVDLLGGTTGSAAATTRSRDDLVVARLDALARSGRGQTVLDAVDEQLLDAVRERRLDSVGRMARALLRTSGSWPWASFGEDPRPVLARLRAVEPMTADDPAAHVRVLAAIAAGSPYDPDPEVPDRFSRRGIEVARALGDPEVLADALLGRVLAYSGVATHAGETLTHLAEFARLDHATADVDAVITHGLAFMAHLTLGDTGEAAAHVRDGAVRSDLLRLATSRVQFRWSEATLDLLVTDDLAVTESLFRRALDLHRRTELYAVDSFQVATMTLRWEQGRLADADYALERPASAPWVACLQAVATGDPTAADQLATELRRETPSTWNTHCRFTLIGHAVADVGAAALAPEALDRLQPYLPYLANVGQIGVVGPVALAAARLHLLLGDTAAARSALARARALSEKAGAPGAVLRCRSLALDLDAAEGRDVDPAARAAVRAAARRRGMHDLAQ